MIPLTKEEGKIYRKQKVCYICKQRFSTDDNNKKYHKVKDHWHYTGKYRGAAHSICILRYKIPKEIPVVFHNGSTYDYRFIIKELAEEFEGKFECLGENTEKYITFLVPIKKELDSGKSITYKIKLIDSFRFMSSTLTSLVDNLSDGIHSKKCTNCKSCLDYMIVQDDQLIFKCFECTENYKKDFDEELIKRFANVYEFCNEDINKFTFLLRKGLFPYEYLDSWKKFDETSLPDKEVFYSSLNMENITDVEYRHAKRVFKHLNNKNLGDYHDLYVQSDTLLFGDVFENFRNKCIEVYKLDPAHILSADKNDFEKDFFKLMNNSVFGKTMENLRKHRDIRLVITDKRRNQLVSEPNYHTKWFSEDLLTTEMKKTKVKMNKPIYLGLSILDISKTLMYEFWYDYMKPKCGDNVKLCYMDTDSFIFHVETEDFYEDIANDVEKRFDTSNHKVDRPLPTGKNKNVIGSMKDELGGEIMAELVALRPKTYSYLKDDGDNDEKTKGLKD